MKLFQSWTIPVKLESEANIRDQHWSITSRRRNNYIRNVKDAFVIDPITISIPITLTLIRIAPKSLDFDNFVFAFKKIRDYVCDQLIPGLKSGHADNSKMIVIKYEQQRGKPREYAIKIVMETLNKDIDDKQLDWLQKNLRIE